MGTPPKGPLAHVRPRESRLRPRVGTGPGRTAIGTRPAPTPTPPTPDSTRARHHCSGQHSQNGGHGHSCDKPWTTVAFRRRWSCQQAPCRPKARAVAFIRVDPTRGSGRGIVRGLRRRLRTAINAGGMPNPPGLRPLRPHSVAMWRSGGQTGGGGRGGRSRLGRCWKAGHSSAHARAGT